MKKLTVIWRKNPGVDYPKNSLSFILSRHKIPDVKVFNSKRSARRFTQRFEPKELRERKYYPQWNVKLFNKAPQEVIIEVVKQNLVGTEQI